MPDPTRNRRKRLPAQAQLLRLFSYNRCTGELRWRYRPEQPSNWNARFAGTIAGRRKGASRNSVTIDYEAYLIHRIIWKMQKGTEPPLIDHADRNHHNQKIGNLRPATKGQNSVNSKDRDRPFPRGVFKCANSKRNPFRAQIAGDHLGVFPTIPAAQAAFQIEAKKRYGEFFNA